MHRPFRPTHAVILPHVLAFNAPALGGRRTRLLTEALGGRGDDAVAGLWRFYLDSGVPRGLADLGLTRADVDHAVRLAVDRLPIDNPRQVNTEDVENILVRAWRGVAT